VFLRDVHDVPEPVVDEPVPGAVEGRPHAAAAVVAAHDHVLHAEDVDRVLQHREAVEVRVHDDVRDVAVDEHLARFEPDDLIRRDAAVGAADPEVLGRLTLGELGKEPGIARDHVRGPGTVVREQVDEVGHGGDATAVRHAHDYDRPVPDLPGGTVTFVFTDIEDSTELLKRLGDDYRDVLTAHRRIVRDTFATRDGIEIDTQGDAFFFVFTRARDALEAAVDAQRAHAVATWPGEVDVRVRMGLHTGEPAVHEEGYVGLDVVRAARICTMGRGRQILLSETTRALVGSGLPDGVSVFPLGQRQLRGIDEPERVFEIAIEGLERAELAVTAEEETAAAPPAPRPPGSELEQDIAGRFEDLGARLSAGIHEEVLRSFERKIAPPGDASAVDDMAARFASLGDEIDARVRAALAKKGITDPPGPRDG
jgi:class 3 adenylate cyclase